MKIKASYHQERICFIDNFERKTLYENGPVYHNIPLLIKCDFALDYKITKKAIEQLILDNEILRTEIIEEDGVIYQRIDERDNYFEMEILEDYKAENPIDFLKERNERSFVNGLCAPYMKVYCLKVKVDEYYILFSMHHLICDSYSKELLKNQFIHNYSVFENGDVVNQKSDLQYVDFSEWQRNMENEMEENQLIYWRRKAGKQLQALELPIDCARKLVHEYKAEIIFKIIDTQLLKKIEETSQELECSKETFFIAVFKLLMVKMTGLTEINIGTSVENRRGEELKNVVGPIANLVLLSDRYDLDSNFKCFLEKTKNTLEQAKENGDVPFDKLVTYLNPVKDMSRTALFDILFTYENKNDIKNERFTEIECNIGWGKYDYNLLVKENDIECRLFLTYNMLYYQKSTAQRMLSCYVKLLTEVVNNPGAAIMDYYCIVDEEKEKMLKLFCQLKQVDYCNMSITQAIQVQAEKYPKKTAVTDGVKSYTYQELDASSNQLAGYLIKKGVSEKEIIAVVIDKCSDFVVMAIGILKAGCTYLPIDPTLPKDRIVYMLEDSKASCVICRKEVAISYENNFNVIMLENVLDEMQYMPRHVQYIVPADYAAYIIYTSGTTGKPKGMIIEHRNVTSLIHNNLSLFDFTDGDVWSCIHNCNFDFSVWEIYAPLFTGAKLVLFTKEECKEIGTFRRKMYEYGITILSQTPLAFYALTEFEGEQLEHNLAIRNVIFGGEALKVEKLMPWRLMYQNVEFINMYGITETTVHVTYKKIEDFEIDNSINSIGRPLNGYKIYIVDKGGCLCPIGVTGEMLIGGTGVGRGYINNKELTCSKFVSNTFGNGILYRSGDYAYWDENGELHYVGRMDEQIKVRGFRIELGEIETQLRKIAGVKNAVVIAKEDSSGTNNIYAYIVGCEKISFQEMKKELAKKLPNYMIPTYFVQISEVPVTQNGKLDKRALPDIHNSNEVEFVDSQNEIESILVRLFKEILGVDRVSIYDNFFDLGGDSIKAMRFVSNLRKYGYELLIKDLMQANTLEDISNLVKINEDILSYEQGEVKGEMALSALQQEFFKTPYKKREYYYQSVFLKYKGVIEKDAMQDTVLEILKRHDMLRAVYQEGKQLILGMDECKKISCDEVKLEGENLEDIRNIIKMYCENLMKDTDLENGPLFKCCIFHVNQSDYMFLGIHHLVVDGVSWSILIDDLDYIYKQYINKGKIVFQPKTACYGEWVNEIEKAYNGLFNEQEISYWKQVCANMPKIGIVKQESDSIKRRRNKIILSREDTEKILYSLTEKYNTKIQTILLVAIIKTVHSLFNITEISVDMEAMGRDDLAKHISLERSIGWFTSIYPVCIQYTSDTQELLTQIEMAITKVPNHGIGYNVLKNNGSLESRQESMICFNYLGDYEEDFNSQNSWSFITNTDICDISNENVMSNLIIADACISKEELNIDLTFNADYISQESCEEFNKEYMRIVATMISESEMYQEVEPVNDNSNVLSNEALEEIMNLLN